MSVHEEDKEELSRLCSMTRDLVVNAIQHASQTCQWDELRKLLEVRSMLGQCIVPPATPVPGAV